MVKLGASFRYPFRTNSAYRRRPFGRWTPLYQFVNSKNRISLRFRPQLIPQFILKIDRIIKTADLRLLSDDNGITLVMKT